MREVLGSGAAALLDGKKEAKMLDYVIHETLSLTPGVWDEEIEGYNTADSTAFTVMLMRQRTYAREKVTPLALTEDEDEKFQAQFVMEERERRGRKLLMKGKQVDGRMLMVTVFDEAASLASASTPVLRFQAYDSGDSAKYKLLAFGDMLLEAAEVDDIDDPILEPENRKELAKRVLAKLRLRRWRDGPPTLEVPWVGDDDAGEWARHQAQDGKTVRQPEDKIRSRPGRLFNAVMRLQDSEGSEDTVVVSVFGSHEPGGGHGLKINVYDAKSSVSAEMGLTSAQVLLALGTPVEQIPEGGARDEALRELAENVELTWGRKRDGSKQLALAVNEEAMTAQPKYEDEAAALEAEAAAEAEAGGGGGAAAAPKQLTEAEAADANVLFKCDRELGGAAFDIKVERAEAYALKIGAWCNEAPYNQLSLLVLPDEAKRIATAAPTRPKGQVELATLLANTVRLVDEKDGSQRLTLESEKDEGLEE